MILTAFQSVSAKTICSMTFNSADEKNIFSKNLIPIGYELRELVPDNKDPFWFQKSCASVKSCDLLVISGHFGGLFFGENISQTLSLQQLLQAREQNNCPSILDQPRAVFLMGCNTLSSKTPDHRSVNDYLRILVGDGFPLNLAQQVAASRYLNFGQSISDLMTSIFRKSQMIVGFDSTGPLGAAAAPLLDAAFGHSLLNDKQKTGMSSEALRSAFKGTHLKVIRPGEKPNDSRKDLALTRDFSTALVAWTSILSSREIFANYDFIIKNQTNLALQKVLEGDSNLASRVRADLMQIFNTANELSEIQYQIAHFLSKTNLIGDYEYEDMLKSILSKLLAKEIDYIGAGQICSLFSQAKEYHLADRVSAPTKKERLARTPYASFLRKCAGKVEPIGILSSARKCLRERLANDWDCLTENRDSLDVGSCLLAKSRNLDPENADDMLWYCYSQMRLQKRLNRPVCLELTQNFSILGNQLKMNWNCLNRISQ